MLVLLLLLLLLLLPPPETLRAPHLLPQIIYLLDAITRSGSAQDPWRVYATGHSLGGAMATLAAYELATRQ